MVDTFDICRLLLFFVHNHFSKILKSITCLLVLFYFTCYKALAPFLLANLKGNSHSPLVCLFLFISSKVQNSKCSLWRIKHGRFSSNWSITVSFFLKVPWRRKTMLCAGSGALVFIKNTKCRFEYLSKPVFVVKGFWFGNTM